MDGTVCIPLGSAVLSGVWHSVEAVLSGWLEVDVRGLHLLGLRVPDIFESLSFGAHYLVVDVSDQLLGGLSGNQAMNDENQGLARLIPHPQLQTPLTSLGAIGR